MKYCIHHLALFVIAFSLLSGGLFASPAIVSCDPPSDPVRPDLLRLRFVITNNYSLAETPISIPAKPAFIRPAAIPSCIVRAREFARRLDAKGYFGAYA